MLVFLLALPSPAHAQEEPEEQRRTMLEAGIVGGNSIACPGHYVAVERGVAGPASVYGMVETYRCTEVPEKSSRLGVSVRLGDPDWSVKPAVRTGLEYSDDGEFSHTIGANLTFGRRYGARFTVDRWAVPGGAPLVLLHLGGYVSF